MSPPTHPLHHGPTRLEQFCARSKLRRAFAAFAEAPVTGKHGKSLLLTVVTTRILWVFRQIKEKVRAGGAVRGNRRSSEYLTIVPVG